MDALRRRRLAPRRSLASGSSKALANFVSPFPPALEKRSNAQPNYVIPKYVPFEGPPCRVILGA